jgi:RND superfamily putative drug exporter
MFGSLAQTVYRRRWYVIGLWVVLLLVATSQAAQVGKVLGPGTFVQKGSDSERAATLLDHKFHQNDQKVTLVVLHDRTATIRDGSFKATVTSVAGRIKADRGLKVAYLDNPLVSGNRQLISRDQHSVAILFSSNLDAPKIQSQIVHLRSLVHTPGTETYVTGNAAMNYDFSKAITSDLEKGDSLTIPILIIVLLLVFGTLVAGSLPLVLAGCSILLSLALVYVIGHFVDASIYVTNVVTFLGLGLGIDYSLFIVYRFREELRAGKAVEAAVVRTMETTGRAIFFSGLTVAIGMSSLILTNVSFMQSMGLGGMLVPLTSLLAAMTLLPALLGVLGTKVNRLRVLPARFFATGESGMWRRVAVGIMKRPIIAGGLVLVLLLGLAYPVTQLNIAAGGLKNAPKNLESVAGVVYMQQHFPTAPDPIQVVVQHHGAGTLLQADEVAGMRALEQAMRRDPESANVAGPADLFPAGGTPSATQLRQLTGRYLSPDHQTAIISVVPRHDVGTKTAGELVRRIRSLAASFTAAPARPAADGQDSSLTHDAVYVGGSQASSNDFNDALYAHFPLIIGIVLVLTYGFLFYAFRSVLLPLKAVVLNLLSVLAAYGTLQLVFQQGVGSSVLGFTPESGVAGWVPVFLFAFLFGLSMDYEVFLLSRIREGWLATGKTGESVSFGLEKTGRLISSAAVIMMVAFTGFLLGSEVDMKEFGFGLLAAIAIDATLVRLVLVPSIMRVLGPLSWWMPGFLRGFASQGTSFGEGEPALVEAEELELAS